MAIYRNHAVLFVEYHIVYNLSLISFIDAEISEAAITFYAKLNSVPIEPLSDGCLHLADGTRCCRVEID
jgi:hypothetical protein